MNFYGLDTAGIPIATVSRGDRWQAQQRLQELDIACTCPTNGSLTVDVQCVIDILQVRSVVQQLTASRTDLVYWLKRCWRCDR